MQTFKHKLVAIVGLSVEGLDSVKFFHDEGAEIWCCDRRSKEELGKTYEQLHETRRPASNWEKNIYPIWTGLIILSGRRV